MRSPSLAAFIPFPSPSANDIFAHSSAHQDSHSQGLQAVTPYNSQKGLPPYSTYSETNMSAFLRLPREVRKMIYEYCLVVNGHITPYGENYERDTDQNFTGEKPSIGLLGVSKFVRREAASIFYGKNVWRITTKMPDLAKPPTPVKKDPKTLWRIHKRLIRNVVIFAHRFEATGDLDADVLSSIAHSMPAKNLQERMARAHRRNFNKMLGSWSPKFSVALDMPKLKSVTFDVSKLYCLNGCCRLKILREFFLHFSDCWEDYLRNGIPNKMIDKLEAAYVQGLRNELEASQTVKCGWRYPLVPYVCVPPGDKDDFDMDDLEVGDEADDGFTYEQGEETDGFDNPELKED